MKKVDFSDVKGQEHVKRGLEVASAGGHNVLMIGPPGAGKAMLAKRFGTLLSKDPVPFISPSSKCSNTEMVEAMKQANKGVLFLDHLPYFSRMNMEIIRQPLEEKKLTISKVSGTETHETDFILIASMGPCPCGNFTDPKKECSCTPLQIQRYLSKVSGPLLDKIDIHLEVPRLNLEHLSQKRCGECSSEIRKRVERAQNIQTIPNALLQTQDIERLCILDKEAEELLKLAILELGISARAYDKILKVSRTIAMLDGKEIIEAHHVSEAISYRSLDRNLWG